MYLSYDMNIAMPPVGLLGGFRSQETEIFEVVARVISDKLNLGLMSYLKDS